MNDNTPGKARRLHPLTLVYRFVVSLPGLVLLILPAIRNPDTETWIGLLGAAIYALLILPWIVLHYLRFSFRITPREVRIDKGVLSRQHRSIPVDRIRNIEVEQSLIQRMLGIAKVRLSTAGSTAADGVLESVSLAEAHHLREVIRGYQEDREVQTKEAVADASAEEANESDYLYQATWSKVILAGAFKFSLVYIAIFFSVLEFLDPDPNRFAEWLAPDRVEDLSARSGAPGWLLILGVVAMATLLSWITGILVTINRYARFRIRLTNAKLLRSRGLLTRFEDTLPVSRIQVLLVRSNPIMRLLHWCTLQLQVMGVETRQQGRTVAIPLDRFADVVPVARVIHPFRLPEAYSPVSKLRIRRVFLRFAFASLVVSVVLSTWFPTSAAVAFFTLVLISWRIAVAVFRNHVFALNDNHVVIRRSIWKHTLWVLPFDRIQVVEMKRSVFQRRLGLATLHFDTGGGPVVFGPSIIDIDETLAQELMDRVATEVKRQRA